MEKFKIPSWLLESQEPFPSIEHDHNSHVNSHTSIKSVQIGGCNCMRGKFSRRNFVEKTIAAIANVLGEEFFAEQLASRSGLLQNIDSRVKVLTTVLLIVSANLVNHVLILLAFNVWILWLAMVSQISIKTFIKRVWLIVPLFTAILYLPSIFNLVYPGTPMLTIIHFSRQHHLGPWTIPETLSITYQGVYGALLLILRVGTSVSLAVLLTLTTRWHVLLKALNMMFVPQIFVTVLEMTYRYIYLFLQTASDMFIARQSRTIGRTSAKEQRRFVSGAMGALFNKAYAMTEEVHAAMVSRGYTGKPKAIENFQIKTMDWLWAGFIVMVAVLFIGIDKLLVR